MFWFWRQTTGAIKRRQTSLKTLAVNHARCHGNTAVIDRAGLKQARLSTHTGGREMDKKTSPSLTQSDQSKQKHATAALL